MELIKVQCTGGLVDIRMCVPCESCIGREIEIKNLRNLSFKTDNGVVETIEKLKDFLSNFVDQREQYQHKAEQDCDSEADHCLENEVEHEVIESSPTAAEITYPVAQVYFDAFTGCAVELEETKTLEIDVEVDELHDQVTLPNNDNYEIKKEFSDVKPESVKDEESISGDDIMQMAMVECFGLVEGLKSRRTRSNSDRFIKSNETQTSQATNKSIDNDTDSELTSNQTMRSIPRRLNGVEEEFGELNAPSTGYPIKCSFCGLQFKQQFFLVRHVKAAHNKKRTIPDSRPFSCSKCGASFGRMHILGQHLLTHKSGQERAFRCNGHCDSTFNTKRQLDQHLAKYRDKKKTYRCEICNKENKVWATLAGLRDHMTVHKLDKPYLCNECGVSFKRKSELKLHHNQHKNIVYHCQICSRQFVSQKLIIQHMSIHDPNRPRFSCPYKPCDVTVSREYYLKTHIERCHKGREGEVDHKYFCSENSK